MRPGREIHIQNRVVFPGEICAGGLAELNSQPRDPDVPVIHIGSAEKHADISLAAYRREKSIESKTRDNMTYYRIGYPDAVFKDFYNGIANDFYWALLHERHDIVRHAYGHESGDFDARRFRREIAAAAFVGEQKARFVVDVIRPGPDDVIVVHDYHFFDMADRLRRKGVDCPISFYLHTPAISHDIFAQLNEPQQNYVREQLKSLYACDHIGVQAARDFRNIWQLIGPRSHYKNDPGFHHPHCMVRTDGNGDWRTSSTSMSVIPAAGHDQLYVGQAIAAQPDARRFLAGIGFPQPNIFTWGRLDYSKGGVNQVRAIDIAVKRFGLAANEVCFLHHAAAGRMDVPAYQREFADVTAEHAQLMANHGPDGLRAKLHSEKVDRPLLLAIARQSRIGLITPIIDGQNLTAREYVAAQDLNDPGVLVLGNNAGVSNILSDEAAIKVDALDPEETARAICTGLRMSRGQRIAMWKRAVDELGQHTNEKWQNGIIELAVAEHARTRQLAAAAVS